MVKNVQLISSFVLWNFVWHVYLRVLKQVPRVNFKYLVELSVSVKRLLVQNLQLNLKEKHIPIIEKKKHSNKELLFHLSLFLIFVSKVDRNNVVIMYNYYNQVHYSITYITYLVIKYIITTLQHYKYTFILYIYLLIKWRQLIMCNMENLQ